MLQQSTNGALTKGRGKVMPRRRSKNNTSEGTNPMETKPRLILKALRKRAGVTAAQCAQACGLSGPTSYQRYENTSTFDDKKIPYKIIEGVAKIMVGKGHPPIRFEELLEISELGNMSSVLEHSRQTVPPPPTVEPMDVGSGTIAPYVARTAVKYTAASGVWMEPHNLESKRHRLAPFLPLQNYRADLQWAVYVADSHATGLGIPAGSYLLCVAAKSLPPHLLQTGRPVVTWRYRGDDKSLVEILIETLSDDNRDRLLGVALREYRTIWNGTLDRPEHN